MKREDVYSVKIYFVEPVDLIAVVVNTLIELEYETYTVSEIDSEKLLKLLPGNRRTILLLSVSNRHEVDRWLTYARRAARVAGVQVGAFVYSNIEPEERNSFLEAQIPAISFANLRENPVPVLLRVLTAFDARGRRRYVRVDARGISIAFITVKGRREPLRCPITDISAAAFVCEINPAHRHYFANGAYLPDVLLALRGIRVRTAARVMGYGAASEPTCILRLYGIEVRDDKMRYSDRVALETRRKIHSYIRTCLREELAEKLARVTM